MTFSTDLGYKRNTPEMPSECIKTCTFTLGTAFLYSSKKETTDRLYVVHGYIHTYVSICTFPSLQSKSRAVYLISEILLISMLTIRIRKGAACVKINFYFLLYFKTSS